MEKKKENPTIANIFRAITAIDLTYLGYAAGGLLLMATLNARAGAGLFNTDTTSSNFKTQFMLLLFFINKPMAVFWIASRWQADQMALWVIFLFFWCVDASGLWL